MTENGHLTEEIDKFGEMIGRAERGLTAAEKRSELEALVEEGADQPRLSTPKVGHSNRWCGAPPCAAPLEQSRGLRLSGAEQLCRPTPPMGGPVAAADFETWRGTSPHLPDTPSCCSAPPPAFGTPLQRRQRHQRICCSSCAAARPRRALESARPPPPSRAARSANEEAAGVSRSGGAA